MGTTLAEIRARLQQQDKKNTKIFDNAIYPFWNIPTGSAASVRFLPDGDTSNDFFWAEKLVIKLPFAGVVGSNDSKTVTVTVPCVEMWKSEYPAGCPILSEVRAWYKDESMKELANKYWKKRSYITQGFVRENPIKDEETPENPIRRFVLGSQIFNIIKTALLNPEIENLPTDYDMGRDFRINKTQKGQYADYATSAYSMKETPLTQAELQAIETHGLADLSTFLPKKPTEIELQVIKEMFEASVDGKPYDPAKYSKYFKPFGLEDQFEKSSESTVAKTATKLPVGGVNRTSESVQESTNDDHVVANTASKTKAQDILAKLKNRQRPE